MKWNKFRLKTTTEAEDIVSSMLMDLGVQTERCRIAGARTEQINKREREKGTNADGEF